MAHRSETAACEGGRESGAWAGILPGSYCCLYHMQPACQGHRSKELPLALACLSVVPGIEQGGKAVGQRLDYGPVGRAEPAGIGKQLLNAFRGCV